MTDQATNPATATGPVIDQAELEAIFLEILDALVIGAGFDPDAPVAPVPGVDPTPLTGSIIINAATEARLVVDTDAQACARLANCWSLIGPDGATGEDAADALGELCNIVGAAAKSVFEEESHVGIPTVTEGTGPVWDATEATIHHATGVFVARLGLNEG